MTKNLTTLIRLKEIEVARNCLHKLANENPLNSKEVINASVKLDMLLNTLAKVRYN